MAAVTLWLWEGKGSLDILLSNAWSEQYCKIDCGTNSCPASQRGGRGGGGSGLPLFYFFIQGTQKFLIFLIDKTLRITEFRI